MEWMGSEREFGRVRMIEVAGWDEWRRVERLPEAARRRALRRQPESNAADRRREERRRPFEC